jgi:transcriptional regulator with XRE-family HTH domain
MTRVRDDILLKALANVLRSLRSEIGISQEQLALRANVDRTFVSKLESARHQPSLAVVFKLSQALGKTPEQLVALIRANQDSIEQTSASEG